MAAVIQYSETNIPTVTEMKTRWCKGLPLTDEFGDPIDDLDIQEYIEAAVKDIERRLGVFLKPTVIVASAGSRGLEEGVDYDLEEPPYDYDAKAWFNYGFLQLRQRPLIELTELKLVLPNNQIVMDFMTNPDWIKLQKKGGQLQIVPYAGDPTLFNLAGSTLAGYPFLTGAIGGDIPQMLYVSYVAGYAKGKIPKDVVQIVAKQAATTLLGVAGDALKSGVTNTNTTIDGLTESVNYTASANATLYNARIQLYKQDVEDFFDPRKGDARGHEHGIMMA